MTHVLQQSAKNAGSYQIDKFVVCTSGNISITARDEIVRRLKRVPVLFWDRDELIRRIHRFIPQLFHVSDGGAVEYLNTLMARLETLDSLDQIPGVAKRSLSQIFVEPHLRRKFDPSMASSKSSGTEPALAALRKRQYIVLLADQDGGKTALLRYAAIDLIRRLLAGQPGTKSIPVIIRAKDIVARLSVENAIEAELSRMNGESLQESLLSDIQAGQYAIAIDGFSEFLHEEDKDLIAGIIERFCENYPDTPVTVAARPVDFLRAKFLTEFCQFTIEEWVPSQVTALVRAWTGDSVTYADVAEKMVERLREALQLPGSPIPAMIGVMLHEEQGRFITNTAEAIDRYMVIRLGRYAHELGMKQEIDWARKQDMLAEVAFEMVSQERDTMSLQEFVTRFNAIYARQGEKVKGEIALDELLESGVLGQDGDQLGFHRTSFRDFFAAQHLVQRGDFDTFALQNLYARNWGDVLVFAAGLRRRNSNALTQIAASIASLRARAISAFGDDYFYSTYLCGRLLSNSEASDNGPRVAALRTFVKGASDALPELDVLATDQFGNIGHLLSLIGIEHTVFTTVGVPWLERQFKELLDDPELTEDERFILASTYAHLGYPDAYQVLFSLTKAIQSTRGVVALDLLVDQLDRSRTALGDELVALTSVKTFLRRKFGSRKEQVHDLLKVKSQALEVERKRIQRLQGKAKREQRGK